jgi:hypothetical protein
MAQTTVLAIVPVSIIPGSNSFAGLPKSFARFLRTEYNVVLSFGRFGTSCMSLMISHFLFRARVITTIDLVAIKQVFLRALKNFSPFLSSKYSQTDNHSETFKLWETATLLT